MTKAEKLGATLRLLLTIASALVPAACSSNASSPESTIADQMHLSDQLACNGQGKFYDNIAASCLSVPLATWSCNPAGYQKRDGNAPSATQAQRSGVVQTLISKGFTMAQCGESSTGTIAYVMFQLSQSGKTSASLQARLMLLALTPTGTTSTATASTASSASN